MGDLFVVEKPAFSHFELTCFMQEASGHFCLLCEELLSVNL